MPGNEQLVKTNPTHQPTNQPAMHGCREVTGPRGVHRTSVLLNGHVIKLHSNYICTHRVVLISILIRETSFFSG